MNLIKNFITEEEGLGTVEMALIAVVLIGLVVIFKTQISALFSKIMAKITKDIDVILK